MNKPGTQAILFDRLRSEFNLKNDAALAKFLHCGHPAVARMRNDTKPLGAAILIRIHESTGWPVREIRDMLGHGSEPYGPAPRGQGMGRKKTA